MNESDIYREWAPPAAWARTVACLWEHRVARDRLHRVVPDGCADVIVGAGGTAVVVGLADGTELHHLAAGSACVGLRVRPAAVRSVFGVTGDELRNQTVPLDDVVGSPRAQRLLDAVVHGAPEPRLSEQPPPRAQRAVVLLAERSVDETATQLGLSARQLRRLVLTEVGLGPKAFQGVVRFRRFLDAAPLGLAPAAAVAGYADQSHLTREVRRLSGLTPAVLLAERAG